MTFTEAAVHVLRLVGKPLHYKEITDVAIEKDLLSHVGKSPEVTMGARLAAVVKKGGEDNPLARVKPGVFALAEWDEATIEKGLNDRTPALKKLAALEAQPAETPEATSATNNGAPSSEEPSTVSFAVPSKLDEEAPVGMGKDEIARAELSAAGTELFEAEEDDDVPLLGAGAVDEDDDEDDEAEDFSGKRRRRRRRRGRGGDKDEDDLPSYTVSEASDDLVVKASEENKEREPRRSREREREKPPERGERDRGERDRTERGERDRTERGERDRTERGDRGERDRNERGERDRGGRGERDRSDRGERDRGERNDLDRGERERLEEAAALGLAAAAELALGGFRRAGGAPVKQLADAVAKRHRQYADPQLSQWLAAACRAENVRREAGGERPCFRFSSNGRIALWEWVVDKEQSRLEKDVQAAVVKYTELARQRLQRRLAELPGRAFVEMAVLLLESLDLAQFRPIKVPSANNNELHFAAVQKTAIGEIPVAVVVRKDGRDLGREQVVDLRGSLHHYGQVLMGIYITSGQAMSGARDEAAAPGATPVQFIDGARLAQLCDRTGVGVVRQTFTVSLPDIELFDALRGNNG